MIRETIRNWTWQVTTSSGALSTIRLHLWQPHPCTSHFLKLRMSDCPSSRLNRMLFTNPWMGASRKHLWFQLRLIIVLSTPWRRGTKSNDIIHLCCKGLFQIKPDEPQTLLYVALTQILILNLSPALSVSTAQHNTWEMPSLFLLLYQLWHFFYRADCKILGSLR